MASRDYSAVPDELRALNQWVCATGKVPKQPHNPSQNAKVNDPDTWGSFDEAVNAVDEGKADGIGFVLTDGDPYVGIDLDHCRDPENGEIEAWALEIVERIHTYWEVSVSGEGLHSYARGEISKAAKTKHIEVYAAKRQLVVTGEHLDGTPSDIRAVDDIGQRLFSDVSDVSATPAFEIDTTPRAADADVVRSLERGRNGAKFKALMSGDWHGAGEYGSHSEADLALCSLLAPACEGPTQLDRIFRTSGLMREKWDEVHHADGTTYGQRTIELACESTSTSPGKHPSQVDRLLDSLSEASLFCDPRGEAYARMKVVGHTEVVRLGSDAFQRLLTMRFFQAEGRAPDPGALASAIATVDARAHYEGVVEEVFVRVGHKDGRVYLDLCDEGWRVVEIDENGWRVLDTSPIAFKRRAGMSPLPEPEGGGSLGWLRTLLNVPEDSTWALVLGLLVGALHPIGPYPVGILHGEQGSAKSTTARIMRSLIDPGRPPLRGAPVSIDDLMIAASNSWLLAFDNLSGIKHAYSDVLCQLATGGGYSKRMLYTDDDEVLFDLKRPILINGITELVRREDLASRAIIIRMPHIPAESRRREREIAKEFAKLHPKILGALLDAVSCALARVDGVVLEDHPRMADFAAWVVAAEPALPIEEGAFVEAYAANQNEAVYASLESDPVAVGIMWLAKNHAGWRGTMTELLHALNHIVAHSYQTDAYWPKSARALSNRVSRAASFLHSVGVSVERSRDNERNRRGIVVVNRDPGAPELDIDPEMLDVFPKFGLARKSRSDSGRLAS